MRWLPLPLALVVGSAGCDRIFGIHDTHLEPDRDAAITFDAEWHAAKITGMVLSKATGAEIIEFPPVSGVAVEYGRLDAALTPAVVEADGTFRLPLDLANAPYRLVYSVSGGVPTELISQFVAPHLVVDPLWGRLPRPTAPVGAKLAFSPSNPPALFTTGRVMTTERWTQTPVSNVNLATNYQFLYTGNAVSMSGDLANLEGAQGDRELIVSFSGPTQQDPENANGYMSMSVPQLAAGAAVGEFGKSWVSTPNANLAFDWGFAEANGGQRLAAALRFSGVFAQDGRILAGVIPSAHMPGFKPGAGNNGLLDPVMLTLVDTGGTMSPHTFVNPFDGVEAPALPTVEVRSLRAQRMVSGTLALVSGLQSITLVANNGSSDLPFNAGLAKNVRFGGVLLDSADGKSVAAGARIDLLFDLDQPADYCLVTLNQIVGTSLTPVRRYLLPQAPSQVPVSIDGSLFQSGATYVFRIDCFDGYDNTAITAGDFTKIDYEMANLRTFSTSTLFPSTFKVN
jgi:hypothetical protein